jgi:hypothetical protein
MPTLFRFLLWCAIVAGTVYVILLALAYGVEPTKREAIVKIPSERVNADKPAGAGE